MSLKTVPKICVAIDKPFYGKKKDTLIRHDSPLLAAADAFEIKNSDLLKAYFFLKYGLGFPSTTVATDKKLLTKIAGSGKEVVYHGGSGIEDHLFLVPSIKEKHRIIDDRGFGSSFVRGGYAKYLEAVSFASFHLWPASRNVYFDQSARAWHADPKEVVVETLWPGFLRQALHTIRLWYSGPLGFENMPLYPHYARSGGKTFVSDPNFITEVFLFNNDLSFLLDIAHAKVSAKYLKMSSPLDYLRRLPLGRVEEIHISSTFETDGAVVEAHSTPGAEDFDLLRFVIDHEASPRFIVIEDFNANESEQIRAIEKTRDFLAKI